MYWQKYWRFPGIPVPNHSMLLTITMSILDAHTFNIIVNIRWIDNSIERVLAKVLTVFRHSGNHSMLLTITMSILEAHTFNIIVNIRWIDNNIERVLTKVLTDFRHFGNHFIILSILFSILVLNCKWALPMIWVSYGIRFSIKETMILLW